MKIHLSNTQKNLPLSKASARKIVQAVLSEFGNKHTEVSLYFVTTKKISALHAEYFDDPTTTDCISFPLDDEHLGEVFVCPQTAIEYTDKKGGDPYEETTLYIIHGLLHCLGFDDLDPVSKKTMRKMEKRCMAHIKKLNLTLRP